ncbi:angiotensin-converting enzyme-like [Culex pipiens pallens]|uniref:angiotensin-converting enzyme-like n=1 Tax=Culex pipiens pallens TaxID=42434 RepID=UPI00195478B8|nr:angiotensin-converting enzyme-like [Culex pipiens pallens]
MCLISVLSIFTSVLLPLFGLGQVANDLHPAIAWFDQMNSELKQLNHEAAQYAWEASTLPTQSSAATVEKIGQLTVRKAHWERTMCGRGEQHRDFNASLGRALQLLCRSWVNTDDEMRQMTELLGFMQTIYTGTQICVDKSYDACDGNQVLWERTHFKYPKFEENEVGDQKAKENQEAGKICLFGEPDMEQIMTKAKIHQFSKQSDCKINESDILKWAWHSWRMAVGPPIKQTYGKLIQLMNNGARRVGFQDAGDSWREELEMPNLRATVHRLWQEVKPLYQKFHAVIRHHLRKRYPEIKDFDRLGLIPAHILGDMWSQNWETYAAAIVPHEVDIEHNFKRMNWTGQQLVKRAEDFYSSTGLPMMTKQFWEKSVFERGANVTKCHGTAANMYEEGDFRMIVCAGSTTSDFYVVMHEMGHIMYYMLASDQPTIFQDGTNSAFQESIGDTIHLASMSPLHLTRLGLLNSSYLKPEVDNTLNSFDYALLMKTALVKIPALPFAYVMDRYRWDLFEGSANFEEDANRYFWYLLESEQGIKPSLNTDRTHLFDAAAKYHFPDNTPYVRYFLANILSFQLLEGLCRKSIYGSVDTPYQLPMPLHRCDLYGSKRVGRVLKKALAPGGSQHWTTVLKTLTGKEEISVDSMVRYFEPLTKYLDKIIKQQGIPVGW